MSQDKTPVNPDASSPDSQPSFFTFANCAALAALLISVVALTVALCSSGSHSGNGHYPNHAGAHPGEIAGKMHHEMHAPRGRDGSMMDKHSNLSPRPDQQPKFNGQPGRPGEGEANSR